MQNIIDYLIYCDDNYYELDIKDLDYRALTEFILSCKLKFVTDIKLNVEKYYEYLQTEINDYPKDEYTLIFTYINNEYYIAVSRLLFYMLFELLHRNNFKFKFECNYPDVGMLMNELNFMSARVDIELNKLLDGEVIE